MWKYVDQRFSPKISTVFSSNCLETCNKNSKKTFKQKTTSSLGKSKLSDLDDRVTELWLKLLELCTTLVYTMVILLPRDFDSNFNSMFMIWHDWVLTKHWHQYFQAREKGFLTKRLEVMISFFQNTLNVMTMCCGTQGILWIMGKLRRKT